MAKKAPAGHAPAVHVHVEKPKRGRPPKVHVEHAPAHVEKPKRGRKPKAAAAPAVHVHVEKPKRGRPPKVHVEHAPAHTPVKAPKAPKAPKVSHTVTVAPHPHGGHTVSHETKVKTPKSTKTTKTTTRHTKLKTHAKRLALKVLNKMGVKHTKKSAIHKILGLGAPRGAKKRGRKSTKKASS
jgi:hypothetical protein